MAFTNLLDVAIGDPTKASDYDTLADNPEWLREKADVQHHFDISAGDGTHKDITFKAGTGNITMNDDKWIGLGASAGRIEFDDQSTDEVNILSANVAIGSDSAVLSLGAGADATLTHDGTEGVTIAANPITLDSGGSLRLDSNTGVWIFKDAGTEVLRFTEASSGEVTIKLVTDSKNLVFSDNGNNINMTILDAAAGINVPGEVQTTGIGYTDGDNAMTIADGGAVTFAAAVDVNSGAIDGTAIGASSASTGAFTTLSATGDVSFDGGTFVFNESGGDKDFRIEGDGLNDLFFADASTDRIGIGTDSPGSLLDITGDSNGGLIGTVIQNVGRHSVELRMHATGPANGGDFSLLVGGENGGYKDEWGLYDNDSSAFRLLVDTDGNVGIGTASPDSLLDLSSSSHTEMHIQSTGTGVNTLTFASTPTATDNRLMRLDAQWGSNIVARIHASTGDDTSGKNEGYLTFYTADGGSLAERVRIEQDGKVGIGTASPDALLHCNGLILSDSQWIGDSSSGDFARGNAATHGVCISNASNTSVVFSFKDAGVSNGYSVVDSAADDIYLCLKNNTGGGLRQYMVCGDTSDANANLILSLGGTASTTHTTSGRALFEIDVYELSSGATAAVTADGNIFAVRAGSNGGTKLLLDEDGNMWTDDTVATMDAYDDVAMLSAMDYAFDPRVAIDNAWEDFIRYNEADLIRANVRGDTVAAGGLTNHTALAKLHTGAIRQLERSKADRTELDAVRCELAAAQRTIAWLRGGTA